MTFKAHNCTKILKKKMTGNNPKLGLVNGQIWSDSVNPVLKILSGNQYVNEMTEPKNHGGTGKGESSIAAFFQSLAIMMSRNEIVTSIKGCNTSKFCEK